MTENYYSEATLVINVLFIRNWSIWNLKRVLLFIYAIFECYTIGYFLHN